MPAPAVGTLPPVELTTPVEPYAPPLQVLSCDPTPKPGVTAFRAFVMEHLGGTDLGISRGCDVGADSEHHEGRAWDWGVNADDPADAERVQQLMDWLFAPDLVTGEPHANFRRVGLRYVIWNGEIWSARNKTWSPYGGASPHSDHVHMSWDWPGARAETSFYAWLNPEPVTPPFVVGSGYPAWSQAAAVIVGALAGWWLAPKLLR